MWMQVEVGILLAIAILVLWDELVTRTKRRRYEKILGVDKRK